MLKKVASGVNQRADEEEFSSSRKTSIVLQPIDIPATTNITTILITLESSGDSPPVQW